MKMKGLLALILLLLVLLSSLSLFAVPSQSFSTIGGGAPMLVVFAKQDYVYARVQLSLTPFLSGNQQLNIVLPNGTSRPITRTTTIDLAYPNTVYYNSMISTGGAGPCIAIGAAPQAAGCVHVPGSNETSTDCSVSPSRPICLTAFSVDRPSSSYATSYVPWQGVHTYQYLINGTGSFDLSLQTWGISL